MYCHGMGHLFLAYPADPLNALRVECANANWQLAALLQES